MRRRASTHRSPAGPRRRRNQPGRQRPAGARRGGLDALVAQRRRHYRQAPGEGLQDLDSHAAARAQRDRQEGSLRQVRLHLWRIADHQDPTARTPPPQPRPVEGPGPPRRACNREAVPLCGEDLPQEPAQPFQVRQVVQAAQVEDVREAHCSFRICRASVSMPIGTTDIAPSARPGAQDRCRSTSETTRARLARHTTCGS